MLNYANMPVGHREGALTRDRAQPPFCQRIDAACSRSRPTAFARTASSRNTIASRRSGKAATAVARTASRQAPSMSCRSARVARSSTRAASLAAIVGGWQLAGNYDYQPGSLLGDWTNLFFYGDLDDIAVDNPTLDRWFNTDAGFEKDPARTPAGFQKRQFPFRVDGVRGQALSFLNMSVTRSLGIGSRPDRPAARRCAERAQPAALAEREHESDEHELREGDDGDAELHAVHHVRHEAELLKIIAQTAGGRPKVGTT